MRETEDLKVQLAEMTAAYDTMTASNRETEFQHDISLREIQAKYEKAKHQLAAAAAENTKIASDFDEFRARARTVLKQKQENDPQTESVSQLKDQVWHHASSCLPLTQHRSSD